MWVRESTSDYVNEHLLGYDKGIVISILFYHRNDEYYKLVPEV